MDFLHKCYSNIDYQTRVVRFKLPNDIGYKWAGRGKIKQSHIVLNLKANKMLSSFKTGFIQETLCFSAIVYLVLYVSNRV